jgi:hypothetical protein
MSPTTVTLSVTSRKVELFKTAVFRFLELHSDRFDEQLVLRTSGDRWGDAVQAEVEFSSSDTATAFSQFLRVTHPGLVTVQ